MSFTDFENVYSKSPIYLVAGIAGQGQLSINTILDPAIQSTRNTSVFLEPDMAETQFADFCRFSVLPGSSLIENQIAHYPLANQSVAANAVITEPLRVSIEMTAPAYDQVPFSLKQTIFTALKSLIDQHTALGGYYRVFTPAYIYDNCLLESLVDGSDIQPGEQPQIRWVWNFEQPLLTVQQGQAAQSQAAARVTNKNYIAGDPPGSDQVSASAGSVANQKVVSSSSYLGSIGTAATPANLSAVSPILPGGFA